MGRKNKAKGNKRVHSEEPSETSPQLHKRAKTTDKLQVQAGDALNHTPSQIPKQQQRQPRDPPPVPPSSVSTSHILLPPEADDHKLRNNYTVQNISISAPSKIESKVRQVLAVLRSQMDETKQSGADGGTRKAVIVALTARAPAGNKCISVAEIAKRELKDKWWQYTGCWTRLETRETKTKDDELAKKDDEAREADAEEGGDEEEPAFEDAPERKLVRNVVCLVIYLSAQPVARLKELYSEQTGNSKEP